MEKDANRIKKNYLILGSLPGLVYFYGLFPGRIYRDSASLIELMKDGQSSDQWTALYFRYLQLLTINGRFLFAVSAVNLAILTYGIYRLIQSLNLEEKIKRRIFVILAWSPFIGVFGMTVGRDTVATAGILILTSQIIQLSDSRRISGWTQKIVLSFSIILSCMSILGCAFLLALSLFLFLKSHKFLSLVIFILVAFNFTLMSSVLQVSHHSEKLYLANVLGDMKCIAQHPDAVISEKQWNELSKLGSIKLWKEPKSCWLADYSYFALGSASVNSGKTLSLWKELFIQNPQISIVSRIQRSSVALPPIFFSPPPNMIEINYSLPVGLGTQDDLQKFSELFKTSIDSKYFENTELPMQSTLESLLLFVALIFNQNSQVWGWAGLWISVALLFGRRLTRLTRSQFFLALLPLIFTHVVVVLASPAPNPRYLMASTLLGVTILIARISNKDQLLK
ncbi:hypothetical protein A1sIIB60_00200 [Candidatus Planktophila lacus]|uniref:hypothetical protein n=1 Tax=Candidatus Planktophila lacus TaxID=1884913 RepID=UPI000BACD702|nr:hypothetical protein [Candidatus Planktophila lacus]ASY28453.1 hypothetical protein A1sIIB60_00200 [Candidatus Planktophila lacus]